MGSLSVPQMIAENLKAVGVLKTPGILERVGAKMKNQTPVVKMSPQMK